MGGSSAGNELAASQASRQQAIQLGSQNIDKVFSGFNPQFYEGVRQSQLNSLMPQLAQQYQQQNKSLGFGLASRGLRNSSSAQGLESSLQKQTAMNETMVANQAQEAANQTMRNVAGEKQNVTNQLIASQNPQLATQSALTAASTLQAPSMLQPLGNLFQNWAMTYLGKGLNSAYGSSAPTGGFNGFGSLGQNQQPGASAQIGGSSYTVK